MAGDINKVNQYQEAILGSIEAYYNEKQKYNQYDVTVEATVIDVNRKPDGIYRVKSTNAEFDAYATAGSYYKNDIVLVQIPNGDYKNPKYILGRKEGAAENQIFSFKLPFDDFIGLRYLNENNSFSGKYWANYPTYSDSDELHKQNEERNEILNTPVWSWTNTGASTIGNTRLGIEADWQTYLGMYQPLRGTYGFRIIIKGVTASTEASAQTEITKEEYFTNYDMYGNTYAYYTPYTQQKVIDISDFVNVHSINIYFYQDFNFADASNQTIYYNEVDGTAGWIEDEVTKEQKLVPIIPENISFDNVNIYLGVSAEDIKDESTFLYSYGALGYTGIETKNYDDATGTWVESTTYSCNTEHDLHFVWVHYETNGTYSVIDEFNDLVNQRGEDGLKTTHVFWYRYLYDEDITEEELTWSENHEELRKDWEDSINNESYETKMERYGGANWTFLPAWTDTFENKFIPRGNKSREKFKVVIQHDGTHTVSKELIFTNTRDIEAEIASGAKNDAVVLKCFKLKKVRDVKNDWTGKYEAIEDGSINAFHVYDENNKILYNDDDERYDEHAYYIQIQVRNEDTNKYEMLTTIAEDGTETNTQVAWAFPRAYSMIASTQEVNIYDAAYFDIDATNEPIRYQNFHNSTIKFTIQSVYNNRYLNNTVGAIIKRNEKDHHIERELMFGRAEGQGHEFLPIIEIIYPVGGTYLRTDNEFQIACAVYNKDGSLFKSPSLLTFNWKELGQQSEFYHYDKNGEPVEGYQITSYPAVDTSDGNYEKYIDSTYVTKYKGYRGNVIRGWLKGNNAKPPIFEVTVNGAASYPLIVRKGFLVCNNHDYKQSCDIMVPSRVEFKSDGANPIFYNDVFEVAHLTSNVSSSTATYDIEYPTWNINNEDIFHLESSIKKRTTIERLADDTVGVNDRSYTQYKLVFNTTGNPQWTDTYLKPDNYTYIYYMTGENNATYVAQSIAFDRNYYSSSLVNDWNGTSLTWDEENGAILSTMIAAGSKDTNNKFTGVMMGDWHAKGDESLDVPGLYGYNKGGQTFGFKTDGTGFIGASGKGRIEFDGTEALISNADRNCYINLNPISLDLENYWNVDNQSFSQNFIYCKVPKAKNNFSDLYNGILGKQSWARTYFEDAENNYFVVDPNYGVLTTGGIVARYGALGNWMISNEGLYQKDAGKYMYIGYDSTDTETGEDQRYCIYAGTDFGALGDLESAPGINPYFYVTWDGTLFARKGLIANTWTIDDTSLQYIKSNEKLTNREIFDKIYIGQGEANSAIILPDIEEKIYPDATTRPIVNRWAISAGQLTDYTESSGKEDTDYINFGVTLSGELYSQLGTIGGWKISEYDLQSINNRMRFNARNGQIIIGEFINDEGKEDQTILIDGQSGTIVLNHTWTGGEKDFNTAQIWMAGYVLAAKTEKSVTYPRISSSKSEADLSEVISGSTGDTSKAPNGWYNYEGASLASSMTIASNNYTVRTNDKSFNNVDIFQIVSQTDVTGNYGVNLATGSSEGIKTVAFYPVGCTETYPVLGQKSALWNLYANEIDCVTLNNAGTISAKMFVMHYETVATEPWVYKQLQGIWNALNKTNSGVGGLSNALGGLASNVNDNCVTFLDWAGSTASGGKVNLILSFYNTLSGKTVRGTAPLGPGYDLASGTHSHKIAIDGTSLQISNEVMSSTQSYSLSHHHKVSGSMSGDGILTVTVDDANFTKATGEYTIDCSAWLVSKVHEIFDANTVVSAYVNAPDDSKSGTATASGTAKLTYGGKTSTKNYSNTDSNKDTWNCTASHGDYTKSNMANAWSKGWNACNNGDGRDENPYL